MRVSTPCRSRGVFTITCQVRLRSVVLTGLHRTPVRQATPPRTHKVSVLQGIASVCATAALAPSGIPLGYSRRTSYPPCSVGLSGIASTSLADSSSESLAQEQGNTALLCSAPALPAGGRETRRPVLPFQKRVYHNYQ